MRHTCFLGAGAHTNLSTAVLSSSKVVYQLAQIFGTARSSLRPSGLASRPQPSTAAPLPPSVSHTTAAAPAGLAALGGVGHALLPQQQPRPLPVLAAAGPTAAAAAAATCSSRSASWLHEGSTAQCGSGARRPMQAPAAAVSCAAAGPRAEGGQEAWPGTAAALRRALPAGVLSPPSNSRGSSGGRSEIASHTVTASSRPSPCNREGRGRAGTAMPLHGLHCARLHGAALHRAGPVQHRKAKGLQQTAHDSAPLPPPLYDATWTTPQPHCHTNTGRCPNAMRPPRCGPRWPQSSPRPAAHRPAPHQTAAQRDGGRPAAAGAAARSPRRPG